MSNLGKGSASESLAEPPHCVQVLSPAPGHRLTPGSEVQLEAGGKGQSQWLFGRAQH